MSTTQLLDAVQQSARKGTLLASCEPEVKELMHQIDVLLSSRQDENKYQLKGLKGQLQQREREMSSLRVIIQEKNSQVEKLKDEVKRLEQQLRVQSSDHDTQLLRMRTELNRLSKGYDKLKTRRGLSEGKSSEIIVLKEELEATKGRCEGHERQISHLTQQLALSRAHLETLQQQNKVLEDDVKACQEETVQYKSDMTEKETKLRHMLLQTESQLKQSQDSIKSRDRKIQSLRSERDQLKKKVKTVTEDYQKLQQATVILSNDNQSYQVGVADLELQLTREQSNLQTYVAENAQLQQQLSVSQELIHNKEKLIQSLDTCYRQKYESELNLVNAQMTDIAEKLETMKKQECLLREENIKLKDKVRRRDSVSPSVNGMHRTSKVVERNHSLTSLQDRTYHLQDQPNEVTSTVYSLSSLNSSNSIKTSPLPTLTTTRLSSISDISSSKQAMSNKNLTSKSFEDISPSVDSVHKITMDDSIHKISEQFQKEMAQLATPTTDKTPTDDHQTSSTVLDTFKQSLESIMSEHFTKIDQSLKNALEQ